MIFFNNKKGFSLIELLVAVVILYICLPPFFNFLTSTIFNVKLSSNYSNAIIFAQEKLEDLMVKKFNDNTLSDRIISNNSNLNLNIDKNQILNNLSTYANSNFDHYEIKNYKGTNFYIIWNIADDSSISSIINYKRIVIIVYWVENGKGHKVTLYSIKREV